MKHSISTFLKNMLELLPQTKEEYSEHIEANGEILVTVIIEDIFMPEILKLLSEDKQTEKLHTIFNYIEKVVTEDVQLRNFISITMMEILGNDKELLKVSRKYLGPASLKLQMEAERAIGRIC